MLASTDSNRVHPDTTTLTSTNAVLQAIHMRHEANATNGFDDRIEVAPPRCGKEEAAVTLEGRRNIVDDMNDPQFGTGERSAAAPRRCAWARRESIDEGGLYLSPP